MKTGIKTWGDLKEFALTLNEDQLKQPVKVAPEDQRDYKCFLAEILECDHINPSGEMAEPITDYLPGGEFYDPEIPDYADGEEIVAYKGDIYLFAE